MRVRSARNRAANGVSRAWRRVTAGNPAAAPQTVALRRRLFGTQL